MNLHRNDLTDFDPRRWVCYFHPFKIKIPPFFESALDREQILEAVARSCVPSSLRGILAASIHSVTRPRSLDRSPSPMALQGGTQVQYVSCNCNPFGSSATNAVTRWCSASKFVDTDVPPARSSTV